MSEQGKYTEGQNLMPTAKATFNADGTFNLDVQKNKYMGNLMVNLDEMRKKNQKKEDPSDGTISNQPKKSAESVDDNRSIIVDKKSAISENEPLNPNFRFEKDQKIIDAHKSYPAPKTPSNGQISDSKFMDPHKSHPSPPNPKKILDSPISPASSNRSIQLPSQHGSDLNQTQNSQGQQLFNFSQSQFPQNSSNFGM